jgi:hypothetical protein
MMNLLKVKFLTLYNSPDEKRNTASRLNLDVRKTLSENQIIKHLKD